ncbi:rod shape-determining protein MreC [Hoylesella timonensis]|uniref:Cell shape-determining protein MreC n=1 Tax=Hoylesella timonensis CRIS 5C-B1 TaxID=679189 RepID=D1W1C7_9BACT|nr:rod shape-determining protein MreC [Hoylesella timonensis]EFA96865.1 rod shape-determining protein MreC [Hoylesella timonensis CRIS 5C-B1]
MRNLIEFLARQHHWFVFVLLEAISLTLLFSYNNYQSSVWFSSANVVVGRIYDWSSQLEHFFSLTKVNEELTARNIALEEKISDLSEKLTTVTKDSSYVKDSLLLPVQEMKLIPAKVVSNSIIRPDNLMTINKGSKDGVKKDMGVVCGTGVVGIVYLVSPQYSVVIPLLNTKSNISCKIENREYFGYLIWQGGATDIAYLDDIPRHARFKLNENIVTSGYSSIFPPGIKVGKILHVYNSADGVSYRLSIKLSTNFSTLRDVSVVDNTAMKERIELMRAASDSLEAK